MSCDVKRRRTGDAGADAPGQSTAQAQEESLSVSQASAAARRRVCGPAFVQTLRGSILGREVALICCGEAHEDAIDLTRKKAILEPRRGWVPAPWLEGAGFRPEQALATKRNVTLVAAKIWAKRILERAAEGDDDDDGAWLVFVLEAAPQTDGRSQDQNALRKGVARLFSSKLERDMAFPLQEGATILEWADLDQEAREYNRRRLDNEEVAVEEHDALIAKRKSARANEGIELFDDWLVRQAQRTDLRVEVILEAAVDADEVEMHVEPDVEPAPVAHECLRLIEPDSDEDSDDECDPDDGTGSFIDYLRRQVKAQLVDHDVRGVDPRELGDSDDAVLKSKFRALLKRPLPDDLEKVELDAACAQEGELEHVPTDRGRKRRRGDAAQEVDNGRALPSWEAYFGAAAELLYYSPNIKADYAPFLRKCVGSPERLHHFFDRLYFGTVHDAVSVLTVDSATRSCSRLRSSMYQQAPGAALQRRPGCMGLVPVSALPVDHFLKAKSSVPPRTWVSGLGARLTEAGAQSLVDAAREWWKDSVDRLLADPKDADLDGDYFMAYLRECHRDVYDDIDREDPSKVRSIQFAKSKARPKGERHRLGDIRIPCFGDMFGELLKFEPDARPSTKRERVLAKILVDGFQVRLVDLAAILTVADVAISPQKQLVDNSRPVVIVFYGGADHAKNIIKFWQAQGFEHTGLHGSGLVGKMAEDWSDDESRALEFPSYLHNLEEIFSCKEGLE